jgi:FHS family L-fucose permease-like MFS transporter
LVFTHYSKMKLFGMNGSQEPTIDEVHQQQGRRPSIEDVVAEQTRRKSVDNRVVTGAAQLTMRQSIVPVALVTILYATLLLHTCPSSN